MISRHTYSTLNVRQKIVKASQVVRAAEVKWRSSDESGLHLALAGLEAFAKMLGAEEHTKLKRAADILRKTAALVSAEKEPTLRARALNFCYHDLLSLNGAESDEACFLPEDGLFDDVLAVKQPVRSANAGILDNLRSPFNVGSIFRTADCFGTGELALCGITPRPPMAKLEKTAMGTQAWVPWNSFDDTARAVEHYRSNGYRVVAVERSPRAVPLTALVLPEKTAFIFGNEEFGITEDILRSADDVAVIPMMGRKNSMNVAGAFAVVMFHFTSSLKTAK